MQKVEYRVYQLIAPQTGEVVAMGFECLPNKKVSVHWFSGVVKLMEIYDSIEDWRHIVETRSLALLITISALLKKPKRLCTGYKNVKM